MAERIRDGDATFQWLGAPQLLKHALGLSANRGQFRLRLVWYRVDHPVTAEIDRGIRRFEDAVGHEVDFSAVTYQELVSRFDYALEPPRRSRNIEAQGSLDIQSSLCAKAVANTRANRASGMAVT